MFVNSIYFNIGVMSQFKGIFQEFFLSPFINLELQKKLLPFLAIPSDTFQKAFETENKTFHLFFPTFAMPFVVPHVWHRWNGKI